MYYSYIKKKHSEMASLGVDGFSVVARPENNQGLVTYTLTDKVMESFDPLVRTGNILYEITSDTTCVKKLELTDNDQWGTLVEDENYPGGHIYQQYYKEYAAVDDTVVARIWSSNPFSFTTLTYDEALTEAKNLENNQDFTFAKDATEIEWERVIRIRELRTVMAKKASMTSELVKIAAANSGYAQKDVSVDTFVDTILVDEYNSDSFEIESINDEYVLVAQGEGSSFIFQSQDLGITATHCFVMGYCISGDFTVEISNDGGGVWETATFDVVSKSKISNEVTFGEVPTGSFLVKITMQKGTLGYNPILSGWGILWKNA